MDDKALAPQRDSPADLGHQLQNLRMFLFVARAQSIAGAAKQLFKAPSAITRSIMELEKAVGVQLFERNSRGILLNAYGNILLTRAERIDIELQQAASDLSRQKAKTAAYSPSAVNHILFNGRKLQLLIHLVDSRKISAAAAQMRITQAGASMALARIEAALGEPMFQRGMHGMIATDAANRLVMRAKRVFAELRHMVSDISAVSGDLAGSVVVGTLPLVRTRIFPMAITTAIAAHPRIHVTTIDMPFEQLVVGLRNGDIDAIVGVPRDDSQRQGLHVEPLFVDHLRVVARAGHPLAGRRALRLADLLGQQWILPWHNSLSRTLFEACFRNEGLAPPAPAVESADLPVLRQILAASDMLAVASVRQLRFELNSGLIAELPVELPGASREVALIVRDGAMLSPAALTLLDAIHAEVAAEAQ